MWINAGKTRQGPVYDLHVKCKSIFKYALRFIKNNENMLRKEALANNLADLNPKAFWSEIKNVSNCKTPLPATIEGVSGKVQIVEFWRTHLSKLLTVKVIVVYTLVNMAVILHNLLGTCCF